ncbi:MAG: flagellar hook-associated protein FlgK [Oligoflexales bacterium]|nr:flagellar hook-associated protein FlgK [Oligoflexales bacterium]
MSGLFHTLGIGAESLYTSRQGVDTSGHNIANAHTEGYSRQRVNVAQRDPTDVRGGILIGNGVYVGSINRVHDKFVEKQYNQSQQEAGASEKKFEGIKNISQIFSPELTANLSDEMTKFFNSLQDLSSFPDDVTARTSVRENAIDLINGFRKIDADLDSNQMQLNQSVNHLATEASDLVKDIAGLNVKIQVAEAGRKSEANDLRDQRDTIVNKLANIMDVNYYEDERGMMTVRGVGDMLFVEGAHHVELTTESKAENQALVDLVVVDQNGYKRAITDKVGSGQLRGLLDLRDQFIPQLRVKNDEMVTTFVGEFNKIHREGFGLNDFKEINGVNFFNEVGSEPGAAKRLSLSDEISMSTDAIAAAVSVNAPGDNVNLNELVGLKDRKILSGGNANLTEYYAGIVGEVGLEVVRTSNLKDANDIMLSDIKSRKDAVSGVSLDEEAMDLMKWQSSFAASSKLITTVDEMLETVLSLKR